jgi:hypothetical protein
MRGESAPNSIYRGELLLWEIGISQAIRAVNMSRVMRRALLLH